MGSIRSPTSPPGSAGSAPPPKTPPTNSCRIFGGHQTCQPSRRRLPDSHRDHWLRGGRRQSDGYATNMALSSRSLDPACALLRPAWSWFLGPWLLEQRREANAKGVGQAGDGSDRHVFPASLETLNELQRIVHQFRELLLRPRTAYPLFTHTSPYIAHKLIEVGRPHARHGAADGCVRDTPRCPDHE